MLISFEQPYWFTLLPVLLILQFTIRQYFTRSKLKESENNTTIFLPVLNDKISQDNQLFNNKSLLLWPAIILMTCSLAQPVTREKIKTNPDVLRDIIFIVDVSVGMSIKDYSLDGLNIDRLTLLKAVLSDFIAHLGGNRMGIMVYADNAYVLSPLTRDRNFLTRSIERIEPAISGRQNNLSNALNTATKEFDFKTTKPAVVVISQGANIEGDISPLVVAQFFQDHAIKLHFIGIGSEYDNKETSVKLIYDPVDNKLLKDMAKTTGGEFFWAGKTENLTSILRLIEKSETIEVPTSQVYNIKNYYRWPLYTLLLIMMLLRGVKLYRGYGF